jgi:hypothetical protein
MARPYPTLPRLHQLWLICALCMVFACAKKKVPRVPMTEERVGSRALDYVPRGTDLAVHFNAARLRKSPLFLAAVGFVRGKGHEEWLKYQEKECGFPILYVLEDVVFTRGEDGDLAIVRLGVGTDEMTSCWEKLHAPKAKVKYPADLPDYDLTVRDGLAFFGDPRAVSRVKKMAKPTVPDPRKLELSGDEAIRADGSIELGPFRSVALVLETDKGGFTTQADLEAYSDTMAGAVHEKLAQIRDGALSHAKNPLARDVLKSIRLSSNDATLTVRAGFHGTSEEQLRYVDLLVEMAFEILKSQTPERPSASPDAGAP